MIWTSPLKISCGTMHFLIVHDRKYLPLITAMAVMVTRELARDEDGGLTNR